MEWYYAVGTEQRGPITEGDLDRMVSAGEITEQTLVWHDQLDNWMRLTEARPMASVNTVVGAPPPLRSNPLGNRVGVGVEPARSSGGQASAIRIPSLNLKGSEMPLPDHPIAKDYGASYALKPHYLHLYPAILRRKETVEAKEVMEAGESSCFYHPQFAATQVCSHSGRFICDLCATEWNGQIVSLQALHDAKASKKSNKLEDKRVLWDDIALALAVLPPLLIITWWMAFVTAPAALFICLWKWRSGPTSVVRRSRFRYLIAGILSALQVFGLLYFVIAISSSI
ncbi:MAG: DUF4339 domain-containing protein [Verrucomicrobiota bacterium]